MSFTHAERLRLAEAALAMAEEAGQLVMSVYESAFEVSYKDEDDPVTLADKMANELLCEKLRVLTPACPVVAEESPPETYAEYRSADASWFVDPVDGTRDFVAKNGEFVVMLGLSEQGVATLGVIVCPALGVSYLGVVGGGAWRVRNGTREVIRPSRCPTLSDAAAVVSRSRRPPSLEELLRKLHLRSVVPTGSSGLKGARVAEGAAEIYVQTGSCGMLWDACAPDALVQAAGGRFTDLTGDPFDYRGALENTRGMLATNGLVHTTVLDARA